MQSDSTATPDQREVQAATDAVLDALERLTKARGVGTSEVIVRTEHVNPSGACVVDWDSFVIETERRTRTSYEDTDRSPST